MCFLFAGKFVHVGFFAFGVCLVAWEGVLLETHMWKELLQEYLVLDSGKDQVYLLKKCQLIILLATQTKKCNKRNRNQ